MSYDEMYNEKNSKGEGFSIGEDDEKIQDAAEREGWTVEERISISLIRCADEKGDEFLVGGDGMGRSPWAIAI